jgi:membrane protease YdiL (CAAX protease family)
MDDSAATISPGVNACAALFALVLPTLVTLVYFVWLVGYPTEIRWTAYSTGKVVQFAFPLAWVMAVQRRRLRWQSPGGRGLLQGIGFGLFVLAAMLIIYGAWLQPAGYMDTALRSVHRELARFGMDSPVKYLALGLFYCVLHSLLEEYYWRWFVFGELRRLVSLWPAVLISSLGFMAHHVIVLGRYFGQWSAATVLFSLAVAVGGAVWAWIYYRSNSLLGPWLSHMLVDAGLFLIGYQMAFGS